MKKRRITIIGVRANTILGGGVDASGWQTDVPGLVAVNRPGSLDWHSRFHKVKTPWQLFAVDDTDQAVHICSAYKRDQVVEIAALLAPLGDWSVPLHELDTSMIVDASRIVRDWWANYNDERAVA